MNRKDEKSENDFENVHLALFFKDFAAWIRSSCVGLNVAGFTTAKFLREHGIDVTVFPVRHNVDVVSSINRYNETHKNRLTHVVISAPWLSVYDMKSLIKNFPDIQFVILSHSNVGFLQADPQGVRLYRQYAELSKTYKNLRVGGNSTRFAKWFQIAYNEECICLPNLYPSFHINSKTWKRFSPIKIGAFGAIRPEKNFMTAAAAAVAIHSVLKIPVELHMSTGGGEECKSTTLRSIIEMTENIEGVTLIRHDWETWDKFILLIKDMDLLLQVSYTESFNMITADGISVGVPSVVSPVIFWAPDSWKANPDDAIEVAKVGIQLLTQNQHCLGYDALNEHNEKSLKYWLKFLQK
jgi:glycosyltransferase involved in cell wall biosynthesis